MKTCIIIPAYNEAKTIGEVLKQIKAMNLEVIVIDDGSNDKTYEIAKKTGAVVLKNTFNQGKGKSLRLGFSYAVDKNFDEVITMDADGQHLPKDILKFIKLAEESKSSILVGNRMNKTEGMPFVRVITNKVMSWLISGITGQEIPDSQCGFRLIKKEVLRKLNLTTSKYETESEILIKACRLGFKIESVPIETVYRGGKSCINPFLDTFRFIRYIIKELWTTPS